MAIPVLRVDRVALADLVNQEFKFLGTERAIFLLARTGQIEFLATVSMSSCLVTSVKIPLITVLELALFLEMTGMISFMQVL